MPARKDLKKILLFGSGPIVIGQGCEFDYSGTQACKILKQEGYEVILVNSNPATIMTDPELAHRTYIEPLLAPYIEKIIERERPDALLPTLGGQTALNLARELAESGVLDRYHVELIGAQLPAICKAENREEFKQAMLKIGLDLPKSGLARSLKEAQSVLKQVGLPAIIRPSFTLGGTGGSIAYNKQEFEEFTQWGLEQSPVGEVLIEESVLGWKEFELEVMRDLKDNTVIVCSIENLDPMGIHTGDSITVAPAQTLSDKDYQKMRDASIKIMREIGVDTGGSNIQFALHPDTGHMVVIEMNPRVSRSSALASKATGFPIAKIAAKLAVGYLLPEILNDITYKTPACFEPTIDYVVTKIPKFAFEKFPQADPTLTTQMKSVGEVMAIGRTFKESLLKAIRSLEANTSGFEPIPHLSREKILDLLKFPRADRIFKIAEAFRRNITIEDISQATAIDPWFLRQIEEIILFEKRHKDAPLTVDTLREAKKMGFSDLDVARIFHCSLRDVETARDKNNIRPVYKTVDTCGAEFEAHTPYFYSTYEQEDESFPSTKKKIMILGSGPNRIGQGIEFDYCCVHASLALREEGFETIMVNCNPETVSTDYDISDKLYFEPLTKEDVLHIIRRENPHGVIVQFGGQTPLNLAKELERAGAPIIGTSPDMIDRAEDRDRFKSLIDKLQLRVPESGAAHSIAEAVTVANRTGYPVIVRPSYVLGGRAMEIVYDEETLKKYMVAAVAVSRSRPVLIERFLKDAIEVDVDALCDGPSCGNNVYVAGIMEHIEEAGIHSGDSSCSLPPFSLGPHLQKEIERQSIALAQALEVRGLLNIQFAIQQGEIYILEVNPRASRTVPFVSKATGIPLAQLAAKIMIGKTLPELLPQKTKPMRRVAVKEVVFPFVKFPGCDVLLGPEMKSTGEVMGIDRNFALAFAKAALAAGQKLPTEGTVFISVKDDDKPKIVEIAERLAEYGFEICATIGTAAYLRKADLNVRIVKKVYEGRPHIVDFLKNGDVDLLINTTFGAKEIADSYLIRRTALLKNIPYYTVLSAAKAAVAAIGELKKNVTEVQSLQELYD